jgi:hypothetical protein
MEQNDKLDRFLDRALADYGTATPRSGFEQRILANMAAQRQERDRNWRWLWIAVPVAATVLLVCMFALRPTPAHTPENKAAVAPIINRVPNATASTAQPNRTPPLRARVRTVKNAAPVLAKQQNTPEPRLPTFPSPDDDEQARLLLQFVRRNPATAQAVLKEQEEFRAMIAQSQQDSLQLRSEEQ